MQVASAIEAAAPGTHVESTSNEAVDERRGRADRIYHTVVWILGDGIDEGPYVRRRPSKKRSRQFIAGGGNLFVTGSEIGFDLDEKDNGRRFYRDTLKSKFVADSAKTYDVASAPGSIFDGLKFSFDNGSQFYNVTSADVIEPQEGAKAALNYANGAGAAGIQAAAMDKKGSVVMFGFPFETITTAANRAEVMRRVLAFFSGQKSRTQGI